MISSSRGRPRSKTKHEAILKATAELLLAVGFDGLTIEGIAAEAGASKQTLYRWWNSKIDLVLETLAAGHLSMDLPLPADTRDLRTDLRSWMLEIFGRIDQVEAGRLIPEILAAVAGAGERSQKLYEALIFPIRTALEQRFIQQLQTHPESLTASPSFLAEVVSGSLMVHFIFGDLTSELWIEELLNLVCPVLQK